MLKIRAARVNDSVALLQVRREAISSKAPSHYGQSTLAAWVVEGSSDRVTSFEKAIADPETVTIVAEDDNEVIGFAIAVPAECKLRAIYVKPNQIRRLHKCRRIRRLQHPFKHGLRRNIGSSA